MGANTSIQVRAPPYRSHTQNGRSTLICSNYTVKITGTSGDLTKTLSIPVEIKPAVFLTATATYGSELSVTY